MDHRGRGDSSWSSDPLPPQTSLPKYSILDNNSSPSPSPSPSPPPPPPTTTTTAVIKPPPEGRRVPPRRPLQSDRAGICYKCVCCCFCFWFLLILALVGLVVLLYSILQPRSPSFSVQHFQVNAFNLEQDSSVLSTEMVLILKSKNPNRVIGFFYGRGSSVSMWYNGTVFSSGKLPPFRQDPDSTTLTNVAMQGTVEFGREIRDLFRKDEQEEGRIPLLVMFKAPVAVVIQSFPLREIAVFVNGSLVVDSLSHPDRIPKILSSQYSYSIGL